MDEQAADEAIARQVQDNKCVRVKSEDGLESLTEDEPIR